MAHKLTGAQCRNLRHSGQTRSEEQRGDGGGLYLRADPASQKLSAAHHTRLFFEITPQLVAGL